MSTKGVAISLFSGAGGMDLGAERAGYEVRAAVEWDRDAAATMEKNFDHLVSPVIQKRHPRCADQPDPRSSRPQGQSAAGPAHRRAALHPILQIGILAGMET